MLRKRESYTHFTPIPACVPRQLALDILHSHGEIITLNPLVLSYQPIAAPRDAAADEFYFSWYEIVERVQYLPGLGKIGSGKVNFHGCFHNTDWGLETHTFVPLGIEIKSRWRIAGNQVNEPRKFTEFRHDRAPENGLYLQEDIEINCNITLVSFVKGQLKAASKVLVDRLIKKAELLDAGVLQGYVEGGRLKTINPADRSSVARSDSLLSSSRRHSDMGSLRSYELPRSPTGSIREQSAYSPSRGSQRGSAKQGFVAELPADFHHRQPSQDSPNDRSRKYAAELPATMESPEGYVPSKHGIQELPPGRQ
ncbi:hypothetical protein N7539_004182 [Penicillium diatomitis]|uniref:DUF7053 domain-containing protein n=1 Tax=Penicillium diatomitis TaxID=2819901 RepID=A0A9W9XEJ9_9EURO|nr:uncharacterized protein N7539_004182 [Penicillium diatomitis]KAJ5489292.1 hypothetical protein N7539_004182 [Penicillium diatomitis]